ncbi:MAG TPA: tryptophan dimethylallyltransferase family protein [Polyangiaceae bacterium]|jgi:DMATS type aromatic prenyltransferase
MNHARIAELTNHHADAEDISLGDFAHQKLEKIGAALGRPDLYDRGGPILRDMIEGWSALPVAPGPHWPSDITDDGSPFEYSITFGAGRAPELRILSEAQGEGLTGEASWNAGLRLNSRLAARYGADLSAFARVQDLFAPMPSIPSRFSLWHAAALDGAVPSFKAYLNPWVAGSEAAPRLVQQALGRLGLQGAAAGLSPHAPLVYLSLDLVAATSARTKVYAAHHRASASEIASRLGGRHRDIARAIESLAGTDGILTSRPVQTCHAFRANGAAEDVTVYVPVRSYVDHDAQALDRACALLSPADAETLHDVVHAIAERPLTMGRGLVTYVALRPSDGRVSVYLSPEAYAILAPRRTPSAAPPKDSMVRELAPGARPRLCGATIGDVQRTVAEQRDRLAVHPFLTHLQERATVEDVRTVAPHVAFFVLCFQDVLRLVHEHTTDPELKAIAETHRREDAGHDLWYLHDLDRLGVSLGVRDLFADERARIRDVAYTQISDALRSSDDRSRLGVVLALEAAGAEFFGSMIAGLERLSHDEGLLYFARPHQKVEQSHDLFEDEASERMNRIAVPADVLREVLEVVERTFGTMTSLADELFARVSMGAVE